MLLPLLLALLSPRALGWASGGEGGGREIVLPQGAVSKLSAPSQAEAHPELRHVRQFWGEQAEIGNTVSLL